MQVCTIICKNLLLFYLYYSSILLGVPDVEFSFSTFRPVPSLRPETVVARNNPGQARRALQTYPIGFKNNKNKRNAKS